MSELSAWQEWGDRGPVHHWHLVLGDRDARKFDGERLAMIQDGLWLIEQAMKARTDGPLSTPRLRLPIRT